MDSLFMVFLVWVVGFGLLGIFIRKRVASFFIGEIKLPEFINFLIISVPFIVIEEAMTCHPSFPICLQVTLPALLFHLSIFYLFTKLVRLKEGWNILSYGAWGSIGEFIINGKLTTAIALGIPIMLLLIVLNTLIYMAIVIVPNYYLIARRK